MNRKVLTFSALAIAVILIASCGQQTKDFSYTTQSSEALKLFNDGLEKLDQLQLDGARNLFDQAIVADPSFAMAYFYRAQTAFSAADFRAHLKEAMAKMENVTEPEKLAIMSMKANSDDKPGEARQHLMKLVELLPESRRAHYMLGVFYYGQQEWPNAEAELSATTNLDPEFAPAYNMLGYAYSNQNKYSEAIEALRKYSELRPTDPNPHDSMGEIYLYMGDHENSIQAYNASLNEDPTFNVSHAGIGHNLVFTGQYDEAREQYKYYLTQAKSEGDTNTYYFWTATSYIHEGNYDKAIEVLHEQFDYAKAHDNTVIQGNVCNQLALIYLERGDYKKAMEEAERQRELAKDPDIQVTAREGFLRACNGIEARLYTYQGKNDRADELLVAVKKSADESLSDVNVANWHGVMGIVAYMNKNYEKALEHFEQSNELNKYQTYYQALTYEAMGQNEKANELFSEVAGWNRNGLVYALIRDKAKAKIMG